MKFGVLIIGQLQENNKKNSTSTMGICRACTVARDRVQAWTNFTTNVSCSGRRAPTHHTVTSCLHFMTLGSEGYITLHLE